MKQEINFINEIFDCELVEEDYDKNIEDVLDWDSFMIMNLMSAITEKYHIMITIDQISEIGTVIDLMELLKSFE